MKCMAIPIEHEHDEDPQILADCFAANFQRNPIAAWMLKDTPSSGNFRILRVKPLPHGSMSMLQPRINLSNKMMSPSCARRKMQNGQSFKRPRFLGCGGFLK